MRVLGSPHMAVSHQPEMSAKRGYKKNGMNLQENHGGTPPNQDMLVTRLLASRFCFDRLRATAFPKPERSLLVSRPFNKQNSLWICERNPRSLRGTLAPEPPCPQSGRGVKNGGHPRGNRGSPSLGITLPDAAGPPGGDPSVDPRGDPPSFSLRSGGHIMRARL